MELTPEVFRTVTLDDAEALCAIYAPFVENSTVSFEYEVPSTEEFSKRIEAISKDYPYIIYQSDGETLGFAYAHRAAERAAYQWDAELSIYVKKTFQNGLHIGKRLLEALLKILEMQNVVNVYSLVTEENDKSIRFHERNGFKLLGVQEHTGFKNGRWLSVNRYEKTIGDISSPPKPFISFSQLPQEKIEEVYDSVWLPF